MLVSHVQTRFLDMHVLRDYVYRCTWILTLMKPNAYPHACTMHDNTASGIKPGPSLAVLHTLQASGVARFCVCVCLCVYGVCVCMVYVYGVCTCVRMVRGECMQMACVYLVGMVYVVGACTCVCMVCV